MASVAAFDSEWPIARKTEAWALEVSAQPLQDVSFGIAYYYLQRHLPRQRMSGTGHARVVGAEGHLLSWKAALVAPVTACGEAGWRRLGKEDDLRGGGASAAALIQVSIAVGIRV